LVLREGLPVWLLDWIYFRAVPAFIRWVSHLPKPLRIPVATVSILATLALLFALIAFAVFGLLFGYRAR
jgi:hypothetical protein